MEGLHVHMKYKEMFGKYEGMGRKIFANVCLYKLTENTNT